MKLIFMGTPAFALPALQALHAAGHAIVAVYTQPPRPAGRGQKEQPSPVHAYAEAHDIPVYTPVSLKSPDVQAQFAAHNAEAAIVAAYGLLLPKEILGACPKGCINIHPSLLPRWRGAAPIQRTLMAGDSETGVCIMQMEEGLDTGAVLACERFIIPEDMEAGGLHDALASIAAPLLLRTLETLETLTPAPQAEEGITYAAKITKADARIDWTKSASDIAHQVRALSPAPGAFFEYQGEMIKVFSVTPHDSPTTIHDAPGTLLAASPESGLVIACGKGVLTVREAQRPGKKRMQAAEMLRGFPMTEGSSVA